MYIHALHEHVSPIFGFDIYFRENIRQRMMLCLLFSFILVGFLLKRKVENCVKAFSNGFVVDNEWESFKQVWGKKYQPTEDSMRWHFFGPSIFPEIQKYEKIIRRSIWERNKAMVESHNKKAEKSFTMALNEASDWTEEEVIRRNT